MSISLLCVAGAFVSQSFRGDSRSFVELMRPAERTDFGKVLDKYEWSNYVTPERVRSKAGKNIVIISLESFERSFLEGKFSELTPNLQRLRKEWSFIDMEQNHGSEWTSGSLYTCLTGFPAYFGANGNSVFKNTTSSSISSITHALGSAGYEITFLNGNASFSGVSDMLSVLEVDSIIDVSTFEDGSYPKSYYGLRDLDLFELTKHRIEAQTEEGSPFAIILSTTDTHSPDGYYDERMEELISPKESRLQFMLACVDHMVGELISYLEENELLENTSVFILPDHLKMGNPDMFSGEGERGLYVMTNTSLDLQTTDLSDNVYQIDLPNIIMDGSEVGHNLNFLADYISGDKNDFIRSHGKMLTEINVNGLLRNDTVAVDLETITQIGEVSKRYAEYKKDTARYIAHAGGTIKGFNYTNSIEAMDRSYKNGVRLFEIDFRESSDKQLVAVHDWPGWSKMTGYEGEAPVSKEVFLQQKLYGEFTPMSVDEINQWFAAHTDAVLVTDKITDADRFTKEFDYPDRLMMELFNMKQVRAAVKAGVKYPMASQFIMKDLDQAKIDQLKAMGVGHVGLSRRIIPFSSKRLKLLKDNGIKVYAFLINHDVGYDEEYVVKYEMDYIYGIYADDWVVE
ncbi:MAG: sulfatase-like hydrolase/transferase [Saprospiraceae bacterium]